MKTHCKVSNSNHAPKSFLNLGKGVFWVFARGFSLAYEGLMSIKVIKVCMNDVVLIDGSVVHSASEPWRFECECRHIANLPDRVARKRFLDELAKRRGQQVADEVESFVRTNFKILRG